MGKFDHINVKSEGEGHAARILRQKKEKLAEQRQEQDLQKAVQKKSIRTFPSKYEGICSSCGGGIKVGEEISWNPDTKKATHGVCPTIKSPPPDKNKPRLLESQYDGICITCGKDYSAGTSIFYRKTEAGSQCWHKTCAEPDPDQAPPKRKFTNGDSIKYTQCQVCGDLASRYVKIYRSGECKSCYEERKMGY